MKILVINGHPSKKSFTAALAQSYVEGARSHAASVDVLHLGDLKFDPSLHEGYREVMPLEPDLIRAQELITESDHIVVCYPHWWGSAPAVLKGFIDRVFLPGFAFKYHAKGAFWDKLLKGRSGEILLCSDSPRVWFLLKYWNSPIKWLKTATFDFCGIKPVQVHVVESVRFMTEAKRAEWLKRAFVFGQVQAKKKPKNSKLFPILAPGA